MNHIIDALTPDQLSTFPAICLTKNIIKSLPDADIPTMTVPPSKPLITALYKHASFAPPQITALLINTATPAILKRALPNTFILTHLASANRSLSDLDKSVINECFFGIVDSYCIPTDDCISIMTYLIQQGADIDTPSPIHINRYTPLMRASYNGCSAAVELLLNNKANPDLQDNNGDTPLHLAAGSGHISIVKRLLTSGASETIRNKKNQTYSDKLSLVSKIKIIEFKQQTSLQTENASLQAENAALRAKLASIKSALD